MNTPAADAQVMPVGTILRAGDKYYEVVRATTKTIWAQELQTEETSEAPGSLSRAEGPTRATRS